MMNLQLFLKAKKTLDLGSSAYILQQRILDAIMRNNKQSIFFYNSHVYDDQVDCLTMALSNEINGYVDYRCLL